MTKKPTLDVVSYAPVGLPFSLDADQRANLSKKLGKDISDEQFAILEEICAGFIEDRQAEIEAEPLSKLRDYLDEKLSIVEACKHFAAVGFPDDDAGSRLEAMLADKLRESKSSNGLQGGLGPIMPKASLSKDYFHEVIAQYHFAMLDVYREIRELEAASEDNPGFVQGRAMRHFLSQLRKWARKNNFTYGAFYNDAPTRFAEFALRLHWTVPPPWRQKTPASAIGMAQEIRKVAGADRRAAGDK